MQNTIGYYRVEHTAMSLSMALMDKFPDIKLDRTKNDDFNPAFPSSEYPWMLDLKSGADIHECRKLHKLHFTLMARNYSYKAQYDLSKSYYKYNIF